jgi:flagellar protein FlaJ
LKRSEKRHKARRRCSLKILENYPEFCYNLLGAYALKLVEYFEELRPRLSRADIEITLPEYISMMLFTSGAISLLTLMFLGSFLTLVNGLSGFLMGFILSIMMFFVTSGGFYIYPNIVMRSRASKIDDNLPFATMYLSTLTGTGTSLPDIFKNLAEAKEYGEVSKEAEKITRDIETFGMDVNTAIERAADRSPSEDFEELMWGMNHVLTTGGSLKDFLKERSEKLMDDYERRIKEFSQQLSLLVEMYITLVIVGSIIFTSLSAVMSSISSGISSSLLVNIQVVAIIFGLPLISVMFMILVDGLSPGGID